MQNVFVIGANGFIGSVLTRRLLRDGIAVRAMCRRASAVSFVVMARKGGIAAKGSTIANSEPNVRNAYSSTQGL